MENKNEIKKQIMEYFRDKNRKYTGMMIAASMNESVPIEETVMKIIQEMLDDLTIIFPVNRITLPIITAAIMISAKAKENSMDPEQKEIYNDTIRHFGVVHITVPSEKYEKRFYGENGGT